MSVKALCTLLVLVALLGILGFFSSTQATIAHAMPPPPIGLVVTKTADTNDGTCDADCSLREAILTANANTPLAETITFSIPGADPNCSAANICTITLGSTLPGINDELTIDGSVNNADITVSGNNAVRPLGVLIGKTLSLKTLTIANGYCSAGCAGGAGIVNGGTLNIANSTFSGNSASVAAGFGGGVIFNNTGGTVNIANSTFSGNSVTGASNNGGAILNNTGGTVNIANSTFYGNSATDLGGGFMNFGTVNLRNSILSGNTAGSSGGDCYNNTGATISGSNNLVDNTSCSGGGSGSLGRIAAVTNFDTTPADNGGPTKTHKLNGGSNALEAVPSGQCTYVSSGTNPLFTNAATIAADQRGAIRPQNTTCDVGAYELLYCSPGFFDNGSSANCTAAPVGSFVAIFGATAPTLCTPGKYQDQMGQSSCIDADPGYFVPVSGSSVQTQCPSGSNSAAGAVACYQTGPSFVVNDAADTDDSACDALPGDCTLREAINAANALPNVVNPDTITFDIPDTGAECLSNNICTITLGSTLPGIDDDVTIDGAPNNGKITVSGNNAVRIMSVNNAKSLTLNTLKIANGTCADCNGGGILNSGTLIVNHSTFDNNRATDSGDGGGISTVSGSTTNIISSTFTNNNAPNILAHIGGAINNDGNLVVTNSTFYGNSAANGGGIFNGGTLQIINSTFSGNSSNPAGGAGVRSVGTGTIKNTIIANSPGGGNCIGSYTAASASNIADDVTCGASFIQRTSSEIALGALQNNGGPTDTMALGNTSAAIDAGDNAVCAATVGSPNYGADGLDQRGKARDDLQCDVGAFEFVDTDGDTISKAWTTNSTHFTFGPTLADMLLNSGSPLTLVVKRELIAPNPSPNLPAGALAITWDATTKESPFSLRVTLCYDPVTYPVDPNTLHVWHFNGSTWEDLGGTSDTSHPPYACVKAMLDVTTLSPLALAPGVTTAVNVTGVKATVNKTGNIVAKWRTTSESQIAGFNVYRKTAKGEWKQVNVNFIQAKNAGSTEANKYRFADKQVKQGKTYRYKIEVIYLDNHSEWTKTVRVKTP